MTCEEAEARPRTGFLVWLWIGFSTPGEWGPVLGPEVRNCGMWKAIWGGGCPCFLLPSSCWDCLWNKKEHREQRDAPSVQVAHHGVRSKRDGYGWRHVLHKQRLQLLSWHPSLEEDINMYQSKWGQCLSYFSHPSARDLVADPLAACISSAHEASHWAGCWEWASCSKPCGVQPASPFSAVILALAACTQELYTYAWDVMNKCFSSKGHT